MRWIQIGFVTALAGLAWVASSQALQESPAFEGTRVVSNDSNYAVTLTVEPELVEMAERFSIHLRIVRLDGEALNAELAVDARMPEHGHGMNREPVVVEAEDGSYSVSNLLFHMPGYWEVYFDITEGAVTERAQFPIELD